MQMRTCMKRLINIFILSFLFINANAQNLVQNGSFEDHIICPAGSYNNICPPWYDLYKGTTRYHDSCANSSAPSWGLPKTNVGFQEAASGHGYVRFISYSFGSAKYKTSYLITPIVPLIKGATYEISLSL